MSWIEKLLPPRINKTSDSGARRVPEGLWVKCPSCETVLYSEDLAANLHVCPKCDHHMRIGARATSSRCSTSKAGSRSASRRGRWIR